MYITSRTINSIGIRPIELGNQEFCLHNCTCTAMENLCATPQVKYKPLGKRQKKVSAYGCKDCLTDLLPPLVPLHVHFPFIQTNTGHWSNSLFYSMHITI